MPKRTDIHSILIIGAGPIIIGQACEFDYSGAQACKALRQEGYRVILVNSNPATIMTDPEMADATYIEPINWQTVEAIIEKERPDALLPTMGGQTALNCALDLAKHGVLEKYGVEMIGAKRDAIDKAEDRQLFKEAMTKIGLGSPAFGHRPLHGRGDPGAGRHRLPGDHPAVLHHGRQRRRHRLQHGASSSRSATAAWRPRRRTRCSSRSRVLGWKEYELEVMRDRADNCVIVCSIENLDPMGVHTGDSITVAPAQTLTDKEYQRMRDASIAVMREIGVDHRRLATSSSPSTRRRPPDRHRDEPARLALLGAGVEGHRLPDRQDRRQAGRRLHPRRAEERHHPDVTPASFEPTIDYVVTKIPRFAFEKFPARDHARPRR
jgi:carbamoyl-phosphate synthase large subunit